MDSSVERLHEAIDELAAVDLRYGSVGEELLALERARARLDAEVARRLREFDRSCEWAAHGSRSAAAFLVTNTRCARGDAYRRVRVAREVEALEQTADAWAAGELTTRHVETITQARRAARADAAFDAFEPALWRWRVPGHPKTCRTRFGSGATPSTPTSTATAPTARPSPTGNGTDVRSTSPSRSTGSVSGASHSNPKAPTSSTGRCNAPTTTSTAPTIPAPRPNNAPTRWSRSPASTSPPNPPARTSPTYSSSPTPPTLRGDHVGECRLADGTRISPDTARRIACDAHIQGARPRRNRRAARARPVHPHLHARPIPRHGRTRRWLSMLSGVARTLRRPPRQRMERTRTDRHRQRHALMPLRLPSRHARRPLESRREPQRPTRVLRPRTATTSQRANPDRASNPSSPNKAADAPTSKQLTRTRTDALRHAA